MFQLCKLCNPSLQGLSNITNKYISLLLLCLDTYRYQNVTSTYCIDMMGGVLGIIQPAGHDQTDWFTSVQQATSTAKLSPTVSLI